MSKSPKAGKTAMTKGAVARIQSSSAKTNGGSVPKGTFASRAQRASAKNSKQSSNPSFQKTSSA